MALRIKSECVHSLAKQIAEITGENLTAVIHRALEQKLELIREARANSRIPAKNEPQNQTVRESP
jgi:hypothetical protein